MNINQDDSKVVKCPICGKLYKIIKYGIVGDQSVCPGCRNEAESNMRKWNPPYKDNLNK